LQVGKPSLLPADELDIVLTKFADYRRT